MRTFSFLFILIAASTAQAHDKDTTYECGAGPHELVIRKEIECKSTQPDPVWSGGRYHVYPERVYEEGPCFREFAETWSDWPGCKDAEKTGGNGVLIWSTTDNDITLTY